MNGTTLDEAIADVRGYIDDRLSRRWTDAQITRALHSCISSCLEDYAARGGDRFDDEVTVTAVGGVGVSLLTLDPLKIRAVLVNEVTGGPWTFPLHSADPEIRGTVDTTTRPLLIRLVKRPPMPQLGTDKLIGVVAGESRPWPAFERWVCMCAALELRTTDDDPRNTLASIEQQASDKVLSIARIPQTLPWPRERRRWLWDLRWVFQPRTAQLTLHLAGVRGW